MRAAASVTAGYLLYYRRHCEEDPRILPYVKRYGDFLLEQLQPNGCVPTWFSADLEPLPAKQGEQASLEIAVGGHLPLNNWVVFVLARSLPARFHPGGEPRARPWAARRGLIPDN